MIAHEARGYEARIALTRAPPRERQPVVVENLHREAPTSKCESSRMRQVNVRAPCRKVQTSGA